MAKALGGHTHGVRGIASRRYSVRNSIVAAGVATGRLFLRRRFFRPAAVDLPRGARVRAGACPPGANSGS